MIHCKVRGGAYSKSGDTVENQTPPNDWVILLTVDSYAKNLNSYGEMWRGFTVFPNTFSDLVIVPLSTIVVNSLYQLDLIIIVADLIPYWKINFESAQSTINNN